jgi:hypothetical protein
MNSTYDRISVEEKDKNLTVKYTKNKQGEKEIDEKEDEELVCAICNANIKGHEDTVECSEYTLWIHCICIDIINPEFSTKIIGDKEDEFVVQNVNHSNLRTTQKLKIIHGKQRSS